MQEYMQKTYKNLVQAHDFSHIGSWELDIRQNRCNWSLEACQIYGISPEQYEGTYEDYLKFVYPDDLEIINSMLSKQHVEPVFNMEYRIIRSDGSVRNIHQLVESIFSLDGQLTHLNGTIQDITEKTDLQNKLGQTQEAINSIQRRFQVMVQESSDIFEIISSDGMIQYISPAVQKITGHKPEERIGKNVLEYMKGQEKINLTKMIDFILNNPEKKIEDEIIIATIEGKEIYLSLSMSNQLAEPSIQGIVINWRDITERIESQREIQHIATHDELTKLPNRIFLKKKMSDLCEESKLGQNSFALIMLDIDGFKFINDALVYQLGDQLITKVTQRLVEFLGETNVICRYSEDKFAIIIPGLGAIEEYERIIKNIIHLFLTPFKVDLYELEVAMNMGISIYPEDEKNTDLLIDYANIALLRAKHEGKNQYEFYSTDMGIHMYKQLVLRNDLTKAIEKNQFRVYYQPQVNLESSEILAAEALIRWEHPDLGMVSPNEFISLAEETGFIINLGNWMLREVCSNYKQWLDDGLQPIKVSVNYSSIQFFENNFVDNIKNIIDEYGLNPHFLIMEITESALMKNAEKAIFDIQRLQALGIQVALDDFGTGFSSLAYLNSFNIDILKIDRSFIKNVLVDETSTIITRSVIDLARELKIKLVAEGIENWEQLNYLKQSNCYSGQGFLYHKPLPLNEFKEVLATGKSVPYKANNSEKGNEHKRKYHRIKLPQMLEAEMMILDIPGKKYNVEKTKVMIKNIGAQGMCFACNMILPVNEDIILQIKIPRNSNANIYGYPVWMHEIEENTHEYGIKFAQDKNEHQDLTHSLYTLCKEMYN